MFAGLAPQGLIGNFAVFVPEYITDNMDVKLPLGREFQKHVNCFLTNNSDISQRYERAGKLVKQLE